MTGIELLQKYPRTASVIKNWFIWRMVDALQDESIDEEFKQLMRDQGIDNDNIAPMIDANPRMLFDVFDEHGLYIRIVPISPIKGVMKFLVGVDTLESLDGEGSTQYPTRKEAELIAIEAAFEVLENQLTPKEEANENE